MLVGTAEILVLANTTAFKKELETSTAPAFAGLRKDAEVAGADAGAGLRTGVRKESGKLAGDMEQDGARAGEGLHKGMSGGLQKLAGAFGAIGLPVAGLTQKLDQAGHAAEGADHKSSGLAGSLGGLASATLKVGAVAIGAGVAYGVHLAEGMQKADAAIAAATGTSTAAGTAIGNAFLGMAGKTEFGGQQMAAAYAAVAGQLKSTEGHALSTGDALAVMTAAGDLATAKQIDLGTATASLAGVMQAFQLKASDAAHVTDVLFSTSNATGQSVGQLSSQLEKARSKLGETSGSVGQLSALLVDMTTQGITGRAALGALNTATTTLTKSHTGTTAAAKLTAQTFKQLGVTAFDASGKFVGMGQIVDQLHPKFALMTQQQQLAAASTLFGSAAARQMTAVILAGTPAYDKATTAVNAHGAAQSAAAKQASTLHGEEQILTTELQDVATKIGQVLIPVITSMVGWFVKATTFVVSHKAALIALAAVVTGVLGTAISVFAINKMAQFSNSFTQASGHVKQFASDVNTAVSKVIGLFSKQTAAAQDSSAKIGTASQAAGGSMAAEATEAETSTAAVDTAVGSEAAAVTAADSTIEADNVAAGSSFAAVGAGAKAALAALSPLLGALGVAAGASVAANAAANALSGGRGQNPGSNVLNPARAGGSGGGGVNVGPLHIGGAGGAILRGIFGGASGGVVGQAGPEIIAAGEHGAEVVIPIDVLKSAAGATSLGGVTSRSEGRSSSHSGRTTTDHIHAAKITTDALIAHAAGAGGLNAAQTAIADQIIAEGRRLHASVAAIQGALDAAYGESGFNPNAVNPQSGDSGVFQSTTHEGTAAQIRGWYLGGTSFQGGGGIAQARRGYSPGQIATDVEASGEPASYYGVNTGKANALIAAYGGGTTRRVPAYVNPLAGDSYVTTRTDQGKDFASIHGKLGAIGDGVITLAQSLSGFGQTIVERLTSGPRKGQEIYYGLETGATGVGLHKGERVAKGQAVAQGRGTGSVELGFWNPATGRPITPYGPGQSHNIPSAGGIEFVKFLASIRSGTAGTTTTSGGGGPILSAQTLANERAALTVTIARERAAVDKQIVQIENSVKGKGVSQQAKADAASAISELRSGLQITIAEQRAALTRQTGQQKAELAQQTSDAKTGGGVLNKLLTAIHTGTLSSLKSALTAAHTAGLSELERDLTHDHSSALASLSKDLVAVHREALAAEGKAEVAAVQAAATKAWTSALTKYGTDVQNTATREAHVIADQTKVYLDKQAAIGLTGAALIAANAQTSLDQVTMTNDQAIDAAQQQVDAVAGGSALAQAQAGALLARANATATVQEAQAQAILDKANAAASTTTTTTNAPTVILNVSGMGASTPGQLMSEIGWALKTGAWPIAAPAAAA